MRWGVSRNPAASYSPRGEPPSTIGAGGLNCRVRNGNGCDPTAKTTGNYALETHRVSRTTIGGSLSDLERARASLTPSPRPISTGQLNGLPHLHFRPINVVISPRALPGYPVSEIILKRASHLDAFSAYPTRRSQISHALGRTTDARELRSSRSSRTRDNLSQFTYGCIG